MIALTQGCTPGFSIRRFLFCALADQKRLEHLGQDSPPSFNVELLAKRLRLTIIPVSGLKADFGLEAMPIFRDDQILEDGDAYDDTYAWHGREDCIRTAKWGMTIEFSRNLATCEPMS